MKKILLIIFGILVIFLVGVFVIGYFYPKEPEEEVTIPPGSEQTELEQVKTPTPPPAMRGGVPVPPATTEE